MIELLGEKPSVEVIKNKHAEVFGAAEQAWDLVFQLLRAGQDLSGMGHLHVRWVVLAYYARQLRSFRAIVLLLEHGLVPEAQKILRPMLETRLHLDFLVQSEDPAGTARLYLVWEFANDDKLAKILKFDESVEVAEQVKSVREFLTEEQKRLGDDGWARFVKSGPPLLSIDDLARKLSLGDWYDTVYRRTSGPIHAFNILTYARPDGKKLTVHLAPIDGELGLTLKTAIGLLLSTGISVDRILKLGQGDKISKLDAELAKKFGALENAG
jgi:hypothetical protein